MSDQPTSNGWTNLIGGLLRFVSQDDPGNSHRIAEFMSGLTGEQFVVLPPSANTNHQQQHQQHQQREQLNANRTHTSQPSSQLGPNNHQQQLQQPHQQQTSAPALNSTASNSNNQDNNSKKDAPAPKKEPFYDAPTHERFPQGDQRYTNNSKTFRSSWIMHDYGFTKSSSANQKATLQSCLGMFECPMPDCNFRRNPLLPSSGRKKHRIPDRPAGKVVACPFHKCPLLHVPCTALCKLIRKKDKDILEGDDNTQVIHTGQHTHQLPHEQSVSKSALTELEKVVHISSEATPSQLLHGNQDGRRPARELHPALNNLGRLAYHSKKFKSASRNMITLKNIMKWEENYGVKFLKVASLKHPATIIMQFPFMEELCRSNSEYAFQTDTLESVIRDADFPSMCVTFTSTYSFLLGRHVPVLMTVSFGREAIHYKSHFMELFRSLDYKCFIDDAIDDKDEDNIVKKGLDLMRKKQEFEDKQETNEFVQQSKDDVATNSDDKTDTKEEPHASEGAETNDIEPHASEGPKTNDIDANNSDDNTDINEELHASEIAETNEDEERAEPVAHQQRLESDEKNEELQKEERQASEITEINNDEERANVNEEKAEPVAQQQRLETDEKKDEQQVSDQEKNDETSPNNDSYDELFEEEIRLELEGYTCVELRELLKEEKLKVTGRKHELVKRLLDWQLIGKVVGDTRNYEKARATANIVRSFASLFPGNISDFSEAERLGFEQALREFFNLGPTAKIDLEWFYKFCAVHFLRSCARVKSNHSLVDMQDKKMFQEYIDILLATTTTLEDFHETVKLIHQHFPNLKRWLEWHLDERRGKCIFPALSEGNVLGHGNNTNGQEGSGHWIKRILLGPGESSISIEKCLDGLFRIGIQLQYDVAQEKSGMKTRYGHMLTPIEREIRRYEDMQKSGHGKRGRDYWHPNDGRAPDTSAQLICPKKRRRLDIGRPRGAASMAPSGSDLIPLNHGLPWGYNHLGIAVTNTCPLDSAAMLLYHMWKFSLLSAQMFDFDPMIRQVVNDIDAHRYNAARHEWINHVLINGNGDELDTTDSQRWNLWSDSSVFTSASSLFVGTHRQVYDVCSTNGDECQYSYAYSEESNLATRTEIFTNLYIGSDVYGSVQEFFDCTFNSFGMRSVNRGEMSGICCGEQITLFQKEPGCDGRRRSRTEIVIALVILEVVLFSLANQSPMTDASKLELSITVNEKRYILVGALLRNPGHYRSLAFLAGRCLMYDGMGLSPGSQQKIKFIRLTDTFGADMTVAKLWYIRSDTDSNASRLTNQMTIGYPEGLSVGKVSRSSHLTSRCPQCNILHPHHSPVLTKREREKVHGMDSNIIKHYCFPKCVRPFLSLAQEVGRAITQSSFSDNDKSELWKMFTLMKDDTVDLTGNGDTDDNSKNNDTNNNENVQTDKKENKSVDLTGSGDTDDNSNKNDTNNNENVQTDKQESKSSDSSSVGVSGSPETILRNNQSVGPLKSSESKDVLANYKYEIGTVVCKQFKDEEDNNKLKWYSGEVDQLPQLINNRITRYHISYDDGDDEDMTEEQLDEHVAKLRVGDKVSYVPYDNNPANRDSVEATIVTIEPSNWIDEECPSVTTSNVYAPLTSLYHGGAFELIESNHEDAPPTGKQTQLTLVKLIHGQLDDHELSQLEEDRKDSVENVIGATDEGAIMAALSSAAEKAKRIMKNKANEMKLSDSDSEDEDNDSEGSGGSEG